MDPAVEAALAGALPPRSARDGRVGRKAPLRRWAVPAWLVPPTLRSYRAGWIGVDVLAALSLVAVALPSQLATARLAGMAVTTGLFAFVLSSVVYAALGTGTGLAVGADSTIAPVLASAAASVGLVGSARYASAMLLLTLLAGALLLLAGALRLGWVSQFLSEPVVLGVLAGIGVEIIVRELPSVLGLPARGSSTLARLRGVVDGIAHTNGWSVGIALGVLALIVASRRLSRRMPGALVGLVGSILLVRALGLHAHDGVAVLGAVSHGFPRLASPRPALGRLRDLVAPALTVVFLCIAQTAATRSEVGDEAAGSAGLDRDLLAIGAGSLGAGLIGTFAVDSSPPNTAITIASGARSQLANLVAAAITLVVALWATAPLASLPESTLGATLVYVATRLVRGRELRAVARFDRVELSLSLVALLVVAFVGIEQGVVLAMLLSLADRTRRAARPRDAVLGRELGTDHWIPVDVGRPTEQVPGALVYLVYAPLWYGNAQHVTERIEQLVDRAPEPVSVVVVDADAMSDIDFTGLRALRGLVKRLRAKGVTLAIARASHLVHHDLKHGALLEEIGADRLFPSVAEALDTLVHGG